MKKEILMFIIGILIGAILTTGVFFCLKGNNKKEREHGERPTTSMDANSTGEKGKTKKRQNDGNNTEQNSTEQNTTESNNENI